jgi:hypothetical protein
VTRGSLRPWQFAALAMMELEAPDLGLFRRGGGGLYTVG